MASLQEVATYCQPWKKMFLAPFPANDTTVKTMEHDLVLQSWRLIRRQILYHAFKLPLEASVEGKAIRIQESHSHHDPKMN
jgi:hypothetical protein